MSSAELLDAIEIDEEAGMYRTLNKNGWMLPKLDKYSRAFVEYAKECKHPILEIGCAYGIAAIEMLKNGNTVLANDLDERHLEVLYNSAGAAERERLKLYPADFPDGLSIEENSLDGVLSSRVFHFFDSEKLDRAANFLFKTLRSGGKAYIIVASPYDPIVESYYPIYEARKNNCEEYPGLIINPIEFNYELGLNIPEIFHVMEPEYIEKPFKKAGFMIETAELFSRKTKYQDSNDITNFESTILIARKP